MSRSFKRSDVMCHSLHELLLDHEYKFDGSDSDNNPRSIAIRLISQTGTCGWEGLTKNSEKGQKENHDVEFRFFVVCLRATDVYSCSGVPVFLLAFRLLVNPSHCCESSMNFQ